MTVIKLDKEMREQIEHNRGLWAAIAKDHGWYTEPFYVQVWINEYGNVYDSVAYQGMTEDVLVREDGDFAHCASCDRPIDLDIDEWSVVDDETFCVACT